LSISPPPGLLLVSVANQSATLLRADRPVRLYDVSTSKNPPSCVADSFGTPLGLHEVADKIGADAVPGMVFKGREPTRHFSEYDEQARATNLITSRILRLRGLEPGVNAGPGRDSYARYIYIHGTNHEERIGRPFSGGCIEMRNTEVIELFELLETGDLVWISDP